MRYLSVCSGIEAATVAWEPLGWEAAAFSEIEAFPRAVLAHHYPDVPLHGDFTTIGADEYGPIDLLVGGTPCQSFSIAGLRGGLADDRGNLALEFLRLAQRTRAKWLVWENVPGVLSSAGGRDFGSILGGLVELGYGFAYRVLDAQYFGVPQRRRRVFVVGHLGDWRRAAAVLFERHSLSGHSAPRREKGQSAPTIPSRSSTGGGLGTDFDCDGGLIASLDLNSMGEGGNVGWHSPNKPTITMDTNGNLGVAHSLRVKHNLAHREDADTLVVAHSLRADGFDASEDGTGRGTPLIPCEPYVLMERGREHGSNLEYRNDGTANAILTPNGGRGGLGVGAIAFDTTQITSPANVSNPKPGDPCHPLAARAHAPAVAFAIGSHAGAADGDQTNRSHANGGPVGSGISEECAYSLRGARTQNVASASAVRRLTPRECERLQGFPDDYTLVSYRGKPAADGPRYKALGNSMAVPVMAWIGERIELVSQSLQNSSSDHSNSSRSASSLLSLHGDSTTAEVQ